MIERLTEKGNFKVNHCSLGQARSMARFAQISITPEQEDLYVALRDFEKINSDQEVLDKVFLLTGEMTTHDSFIRNYPNVFKDDSEKS